MPSLSARSRGREGEAALLTRSHVMQCGGRGFSLPLPSEGLVHPWAGTDAASERAANIDDLACAIERGSRAPLVRRPGFHHPVPGLPKAHARGTNRQVPAGVHGTRSAGDKYATMPGPSLLRGRLGSCGSSFGLLSIQAMLAVASDRPDRVLPGYPGLFQNRVSSGRARLEPARGTSMQVKPGGSCFWALETVFPPTRQRRQPHSYHVWGRQRFSSHVACPDTRPRRNLPTVSKRVGGTKHPPLVYPMALFPSLDSTWVASAGTS